MDVVVCDGFVGNVILKSAEGLAGTVASMMREELERSWRTRLGYLLARPAFASFRRRVDYREYGAAPLIAGFLLGTIGLIWRLMLYRREVAVVWDGSNFSVAGRAEYFSHRFREELATIKDLLVESGTADHKEARRRNTEDN